ncbi:MAG: radical SAM protein [Nitrososphaerota archaeon]|nr:radical SAM protein [Nitrososphaerota archaeon]MDG7051640.1 radical SAM protein [Nitrososphaerota archaeon]
MVLSQEYEEKKTVEYNVIKKTQSICPECNRILPATIFERDQKVYMTRTCPDHGETEELYYGDYQMYLKFSSYWDDGKGTMAPNVAIDNCQCPANCGLCSNHLSHTGLANIIVTNRCDLTCWYCFFYVKKGLEGAYVYEPDHEQIRNMAKALKAERPVPGNSIQITGGEPTLRDDLPEIVRILKEEGVDHIQLNTNGINIALKPELAKIYREAGVSNLYMSFDGVTAKTNPKNHWEAPYALDACRKADLGVVLVPTVIKSINDHELGAIIDYAKQNIDIVRAVNFQPVSLTGRMSKKEREKYRITIPDAIKRIEAQTNGEVTADDWFPVPSCSPITHFIESLTHKKQYELSIHFACGAGTYVYMSKGKLVPISQFVDIKGLVEYLDEKADDLNSGSNRYMTIAQAALRINSFVDKKKQPEGLNLGRLLFNALVRHDYSSIGQFQMKSLFLGMMHFQDKYNQDEERLQRCDIHYLTPDLRIIPFCSFNVIPEWYRDRVQKKYGMPVEEWEAKNGEKLEDRLYRGQLRKVRPGMKAEAPTCATAEIYQKVSNLG